MGKAQRFFRDGASRGSRHNLRPSLVYLWTGGEALAPGRAPGSNPCEWMTPHTNGVLSYFRGFEPREL